MHHQKKGEPIMSSIVQASFKTLNYGAPSSPTGIVPDQDKDLKRYPILFLNDHSRSVGEGVNPDIHAINAALDQLLAALRNPPAGSTLAQISPQLDIYIAQYSTQPEEVLGWSIVSALPASLPPLTAAGNTQTAKAFEFGFDKINQRLAYYKDARNHIRSGLPHIFHITDGAPTDMAPGSQRWLEMQTKLTKIHGSERQRAAVLHFVSPNGCTEQPEFLVRGQSGDQMTGQKAMALLSGAPTVYELSKEIDAFPALVKMVTKTIEFISQSYDAVDAARMAAQQTGGTIKPTQNYGN
jgi:uncharacterized protein YegL